jgi:two-component system, cell cycle response regulator DivK
MTLTVLYIEDNEINAELVDRILIKHGYTVKIATNGLQGIALAEQLVPDIIISDFHLPDINGPQITQSIRQKDALKDIPIIMLTSDIYNRADSLEAGVDAYLNKPIRRNLLLTTIAKLLSNTET